MPHAGPRTLSGLGCRVYPKAQSLDAPNFELLPGARQTCTGASVPKGARPAVGLGVGGGGVGFATKVYDCGCWG